MIRALVLLLLALGIPAALAGAQATASPASRPVRAGVTLSKDTVTVGEPFELRVRIQAPRDAEIRFPDNPDSTGTVQALDPRTIVITDSLQANDRTAVYRLAAWDVGAQPISVGNVTVVWNNASARGDRPVTLAALQVFVRSVLPADSTLHVPKPARALWETRGFPWWLVALIAGLIAAGLLAWWWWRRRRRAPQAEVVDPYERARREFNRLEAMGLVDAGERTRFAALTVEVVRDYLAARYPAAPLSLTSRELLLAVRQHPAVAQEPLSRILHEVDLAKFAAWTLSEERARALARDARAIVEHEHAATRPVADAVPGKRAA